MIDDDREDARRRLRDGQEGDAGEARKQRGPFMRFMSEAARLFSPIL